MRIYEKDKASVQNARILKGTFATVWTTIKTEYTVSSRSNASECGE